MLSKNALLLVCTLKKLLNVNVKYESICIFGEKTQGYATRDRNDRLRIQSLGKGLLNTHTYTHTQPHTGDINGVCGC